MDGQKKELTPYERSRRMKIIIIAVFVGALLLLAICAAIPSLSEDIFGTNSRNEDITVDPSKLAETKEEDFDIFEYKEYLKYDRTVYLFDRGMGTTVSVKPEVADQHGRAFVLVCDILNAINHGDVDLYNSYVYTRLKREDFTQQQIYGILITKESETAIDDKNGYYTEYVYKVEYKIHENNGSFRRDVESDASRPQYFVINDSLGELLLMDVINKANEK